MLKIIGATMLIICSGVVGMVIARNYSLRPQQIRYLLNGIKMLETEILFGSTPLPQALQNVGKRLPEPINILFLQTSELLLQGEGLTVLEAWSCSINSLKENSALMGEELDILLYFGKCLGNSDKDEQTKNLKLVREHLKSMETKAEELKKRNNKIWQYLGFSFGTVIALILF